MATIRPRPIQACAANYLRLASSIPSGGINHAVTIHVRHVRPNESTLTRVRLASILADFTVDGAAGIWSGPQPAILVPQQRANSVLEMPLPEERRQAKSTLENRLPVQSRSNRSTLVRVQHLRAKVQSQGQSHETSSQPTQRGTRARRNHSMKGFNI